MKNQQPPCTTATNHRKALTLKKDQRLGGKRMVDQVFRTGRRRTHHPIMACCQRRVDNGLTRIAISVSKKCGSAIERNAIRRRIREAHRLMQHELPPGMDVLLVVRPHRRLAVIQYQEIVRCLLR
ncbi:MAG: ribonuclease P protein component [Phycisphaerae bacterium]|nr:ribonuclease P protein component [Phycisphaerae bacterium]